MTQRQIGLLIGVGALGLAWYFGSKTTAQLSALALRSQSPSPLANPGPPTGTPGPGTDEYGRYPGDPDFDWQTAGLG